MIQAIKNYFEPGGVVSMPRRSGKSTQHALYRGYLLRIKLAEKYKRDCEAIKLRFKRG